MNTEVTARAIQVPADAARHALKVMRASRGVTQQELADKAGLARTHIASVESGKRPLSFGTLSSLATALDYRLSFSFKPVKGKKS